MPARTVMRLLAPAAAVAAIFAAPAGAATGPSLVPSARCLVVGHPLSVTGSGFAPAGEYDLTVDGVDFGQSVTSAGGGFTNRIGLGGLGSGLAQIVDTVAASDGSHVASTSVTLTRATGALVGAGSGTSPERLVPFEAWDLVPSGRGARVYLHYVAPGGATRTYAIGTATGECGYLQTRPRPFFPFGPSAGTWTLQIDTSRTYHRRPAGRSVRLRVVIG